MSTPLGLTAGNAIEVAESVEVLAGGGPADVVELTVALAREMLAAAGRDDVDPADKLADGSAMDAWKAMIRAQDGDPDAELPVAKESHVINAPASGTLTRLDAMAVGLAAWRLGAGRARKEDPVQAGAGVVWHARPGDEVTEGQPLFTLLTDEPARFERALASLEGGWDVGDAVRRRQAGPRHRPRRGLTSARPVPFSGQVSAKPGDPSRLWDRSAPSPVTRPVRGTGQRGAAVTRPVLGTGQRESPVTRPVYGTGQRHSHP